MNRLDSVLARSEWEDEFFEGIILDEKDNLLRNYDKYFFIKDDILNNPPLKKLVLAEF